MPSTGTPSSSSSRSSGGAPSSYTEAGPPDRITPFGRRRNPSASPTWWGNSSEKTPHSRTRRAISCEYCPPKSSTTTSSVAARGAGVSTAAVETLRLSGSRSGAALAADTARRGFAAGAHPDTLLTLEMLALGLQRRRDRQLGPVELRDVAVAAGRHRGPQGAHQVEGAVVLSRRPLDDLLERAVLGGGDAGAARQRRMERGHTPVEAAPRSLVGPSQRRAEHH